jgi:phosphoglycolate phosphatase
LGIRLTTAFIFDFDGTLVDSEQAIYQCFYSITEKLAPERVEYAKNILIGPPLRVTASEILGPKYQKLLDEFIQSFIIMHDEQVIQHTRPYPGVIQVLRKLYSNDIPMAVATNKRLSPTQKLINYFELNDFFQAIECSDSRSDIRNKDEMIQDIINQNSSFKNGYFVGDTVNDGISANKNQLKFIKASYGYGKKQDWSNISILREISNLKELIQ